MNLTNAGRWRLLLTSASVILSSAGCATFSAAPVYLDVFDCLIPVPPGYAFNTIDSSTTHAYAAEPGRRNWGELNVWTYDGPIPTDLYDILETRQRGRLEIQEIRRRDLGGGGDIPESLIVINDGARNLSLGGDAKRLVDPMIDACLATAR